MADRRALTVSSALFSAVSLLLVCAAPVVRAGSVPAGHDPQFATGGRLTLDFGRQTVDQVETVFGSLVAGSADGDMAVAPFGNEYHDIGGRSGRVIVDFGPDRPSSVHAGTGVVGGDTVLAGVAGGSMALARLHTNGDLVDTFGTGGKVTLPLGAPAAAHAALGDLYNTVFVVGEVGAAGATAAVVVRVRADGTVDPAFGPTGGGKLVLDLSPGPDAAHAIVEVEENLYLVAGRTGPDLFVARVRSDGTLDPTFGQGGVVTMNLSPGDDAALTLRSLGNRRSLLAGHAGTDAFVASLRADGTLDPAFGAGGMFRTNGGRAAASFRSLAFYGWDRVEGMFAAGTVTSAGGGSDVLLANLNMAGTPQVAFGGTGVVASDLAGPAERGVAVRLGPAPSAAQPVGEIRLVAADGRDIITAYFQPDGSVSSGSPIRSDFGRPWHEVAPAMARQPDGRIVVVAQSGGFVLLARILPDGRLDPSFRPGRLLVTEIGHEDLLDVAVHADGKIAVLTRRGVFRFSDMGELDLGFGDRGRAATETNLWGRIATLPDGSTLVAGTYVLRLTPSGQVDRSFSFAGSASRIVGLVVQPDGKIVVASDEATWAEGVSLTRVNPDGSRDTSFMDGMWTGTGNPSDLIGMPDGRFVVVASGTGVTLSAGGPEADIIVSGYTASGKLDGTFGEAIGTTRVDLGQYDTTTRAVRQPDGGIIVLANGRTAGGQPIVGLVRFGADGKRDWGFGTNGIWTTPLLRSFEAAVLDPGGGLVVAGTSVAFDQDLSLIRFHPSGAVRGAPRAWGWNGVGQLGTGGGDAVAPVGVAGSPQVTAVAGGWAHSLAVRADGTVAGWGWNATGQLGDGTTTDRAVPITVPGLTSVTAVAAGVYHSLALRADGTVWAWGWNGAGQLGDGTTTDRHRPIQVPGLTGITHIAAGAFHSLARRSDGTVWAWGWNGVGQLGDATTTDRHRPVRVPIGHASAIAAGSYHSLAIGGGNVLSWGWNVTGQLGRASAEEYSAWPTQVWGFPPVPVRDVAGGLLHTLAVLEDGTVWAWGWNAVGQVGDGTLADRRTPVVVPGAGPATAVVAGAHHSLAIGRDNSVRAWGWNAIGQVGDGTVTDRRTPVRIMGPSSVARAVGAGAVHSLAV